MVKCDKCNRRSIRKLGISIDYYGKKFRDFVYLCEDHLFLEKTIYSKYKKMKLNKKEK